jgi:hypothetical protein
MAAVELYNMTEARATDITQDLLLALIDKRVRA